MTAPIIVDTVGLIAGMLGMSIAIYLQLLRKHLYSKGHVAGLYVFGAILVLVNMEHIFSGAGYWEEMKLSMYMMVIIAELVVAYDMTKREDTLLEMFRDD